MPVLTLKLLTEMDIQPKDVIMNILKPAEERIVILRRNRMGAIFVND